MNRRRRHRTNATRLSDALYARPAPWVAEKSHAGSPWRPRPASLDELSQRVGALGRGNLLDERAEHVVRGEVVREDEPVSEDVRRDLLDVVDRDFLAAAQPGVRLGRARQMHDPA